MNQLTLKCRTASPTCFNQAKEKSQNCRQLAAQSIKMYKQVLNYSPQMLALSPQYQVFPSQSQIFANNFLVNNFVIRWRNTSISWTGLIDLSQLQQPLKDLIQFGQDFVEVYKNKNKKPKFGKQLNKKAIASFKPTKKINPRLIIRQSQKNGSKILKIDLQNNIFVVQLPHFSKYKYMQDDVPLPLDPKSRNQFNQSDDDWSNNQRNIGNSFANKRNISKRMKPLFEYQQKQFKFNKYDEFNKEQIRQTEIEQSQQENSREQNKCILHLLQEKNRKQAMEQQELQARRYEERQSRSYEFENLRNRSSLNNSKRLSPTSGFESGQKVHPIRKLESRKDYQQRIKELTDKFNQDVLAFYQKTLISINPDMIQELSQGTSQIIKRSHRKQFRLDSFIIHQFIFNKEIGDSLKSVLMLYMILYRFQEVQFEIQTITDTAKKTLTKDQSIQPVFESRRKTKIVKCQKRNKNFANSYQEIQDYNQFIQNQKHQYLVKYFQWFLLKNQQHLDFPQNQPMKSLATYDVQAMYFTYLEYDSICQEMKEARRKYSKQFLQRIKKEDNLQNALFVANIRQPSYRRSQVFSLNLNYFFFQLNIFDDDQSQQEQMFKDYHWIIRVATQYFYSVKDDLSPTIKNILIQNRQNFETLTQANILCNQFILLHNYFTQQSVNYEYFQGNQLSDNIFRWIFQQDQSICQQINQNKQNELSQIERSKKLTQTICLKLLQKTVKENKVKFLQYFRMIIQIIQKNKLLQNLEDKVQIFNNLFYQKYHFAQQLGQQFSKVINYWQHHSDTRQTQFIKRISFDYKHNYFFRLQAKKISEPINKLYCYFNILERYVDRDTKDEIINLIMLNSKNSLVMHWSNKVLKRLLYSFEFFIRTRQGNMHLHISEKVSRKSSQQNKMDIQRQDQVNRSVGSIDKIKNIQNKYSQDEINTIKNLVLYLKIILKMEAINQDTFQCLYNLLINDPKQGIDSMFRLNEDHINYMSKRILQMIFNQEPQHDWFLKIAIKSKYNEKQRKDTLYNKLVEMLTNFSRFVRGSEYQKCYKNWSSQLKFVQIEEKVKNKY